MGRLPPGPTSVVLDPHEYWSGLQSSLELTVLPEPERTVGVFAVEASLPVRRIGSGKRVGSDSP